MKKPKSFTPNRNTTAKKYVSKQRSTSQGLYKDADWTKYRFRFLATNPKCYCCPAKSNVVDHLVSHKGDIELFEKNDNHIPLCNLCHNTVTGKFDRKDIPDTEGKMKWFADMRAKNNITVRIKVIRYRK